MAIAVQVPAQPVVEMFAAGREIADEELAVLRNPDAAKADRDAASDMRRGQINMLDVMRTRLARSLGSNGAELDAALRPFTTDA